MKTRTVFRNIMMIISYDGTDYCGWQKQAENRELKGKKSIQSVLEKILQRILREKINLISAGRTDSGVHAGAQVVNFKTTSGLKADIIKKGLNSLLPPDISVAKARDVSADFHATYDAKSKLYRYAILNRSYGSPFFRRYAHFIPYKLNVDGIKREAKPLVGKHDFKSFQAADKRKRSSVRTIKAIKVKKRKGFISIDIEADGFLYNMVRNIVGTLIDVGRGRLGRGSVRKILLAKDRSLAGPTAPARGLCLVKVKY